LDISSTKRIEIVKLFKAAFYPLNQNTVSRMNSSIERKILSPKEPQGGNRFSKLQKNSAYIGDSESSI
jgi:hypothetical protein